MIRGSDGLEYADEAALLLREPIDNTFNYNVRSYRRSAHRNAEAARLNGIVPGPFTWTEAKVRQYIEGFASVCPEGAPGFSEAFTRAHNTGLEAAAGYRTASSSDTITGRRADILIIDELSSIPV